LSWLEKIPGGRDIRAAQSAAQLIQSTNGSTPQASGAIHSALLINVMFRLFGLDELRLRVDDCKPKLPIANSEKKEVVGSIEGLSTYFASFSWNNDRR
jgi:acetyl-CoA synthetase